MSSKLWLSRSGMSPQDIFNKCLSTSNKIKKGIDKKEMISEVEWINLKSIVKKLL